MSAAPCVPDGQHAFAPVMNRPAVATRLSLATFALNRQPSPRPRRTRFPADAAQLPDKFVQIRAGGQRHHAKTAPASDSTTERHCRPIEPVEPRMANLVKDCVTDGSFPCFRAYVFAAEFPNYIPGE